MIELTDFLQLPGLFLLVTLGGVCAGLLTVTSRFFIADGDKIVNEVNRLLPQTQCAQCGYPGCRPYAQAIVSSGEEINRCPPGGQDTIDRLATLLGRNVMPLDPSCGVATKGMIAQIREAECIGCTLCIQACPVDAILGATQLMHTVISALCTGCDLCREPCPVDCIDLIEVGDKQAQHELSRLLTRAPESACINCGECVIACPKELQPQSLYRFRDDIVKATSFNLENCIECSRCDRVCPSELPLTLTFRATKTQVRQELEGRAAAASFEQRYLNRADRLQNSARVVKQRPSRGDRQLILTSIANENGDGGADRE